MVADFDVFRNVVIFRILCVFLERLFAQNKSYVVLDEDHFILQ